MRSYDEFASARQQLTRITVDVDSGPAQLDGKIEFGNLAMGKLLGRRLGRFRSSDSDEEAEGVY
jgi:hypothetical protein